MLLYRIGSLSVTKNNKKGKKIEISQGRKLIGSATPTRPLLDFFFGSDRGLLLLNFFFLEISFEAI